MKRIAAILVCCLTFHSLTFPVSAADLSLEQAIRAGIEHSPELFELRKEQSKKKADIFSAYNALTIQAEKNWHSLLNLIFPVSQSLNRELSLSMKVPEVKAEYQKAGRAIDNQKLLTEFDLESQYIAAYQAQTAVDNALNNLAQKKKKKEELSVKARLGLAKQEDVKAAEQDILKADSALKVAEISLRSSKITLGNKLDQDLESGSYRFNMNKQHVVLTSSLMWDLVAYAEKKDYNLYQDTLALSMQDQKVNKMRQLLKRKFGPLMVSKIESIYQPSDQEFANFDAYVEEYNKMLVKIRKVWEIWIVLPLWFIPFLLPLPLWVFQGDYDGLRYFEDVTQALPVAILDLDKAKHKVKDTRKKMIAKIKKSYLDAKQAEENYIESLKARDKAKNDVAGARVKYKMGLISAEEVEALDAIVKQSEESAMSSFLTYKMSLSKLNMDSGGALKTLYKNGEPPYTVDRGTEVTKPPANEDTAAGTWSLEEVAENMTSKFTIKPSEKLGATHYLLRNKDPLKAIGGKVPVSQGMIHLNFLFNKTEDLEVVLYQGSQEIAVLQLDGFGAQGTLVK